MVKKQDPHGAPPQQSGEAADEKAGESATERERKRHAQEHPKNEMRSTKLAAGSPAGPWRSAGIGAAYYRSTEIPAHMGVVEATSAPLQPLPYPVWGLWGSPG